MKLLIALFVLATLITCAPDAIAQEGADVYKTKCAACHGNEGQGKVGPALKGTKLGDDDIVLLLSKGKEGKKAPHNKPKGLSDDDTKAVAHYVKSLK
jgi:mono/diheme cytochrome c family protein